MENKRKTLASAEEESEVSRRVVVWLNGYENLPVGMINFESLKADEESMAVSTIQGTYITRRFLYGGHEAEYGFKIVYRIRPGNSNDKRLAADELLNILGDWATINHPDLGEQIRVKRVETTARSSLFAAYNDGMEDHQVLMKLVYEVI